MGHWGEFVGDIVYYVHSLVCGAAHYYASSGEHNELRGSSGRGGSIDSVVRLVH